LLFVEAASGNLLSSFATRLMAAAIVVGAGYAAIFDHVHDQAEWRRAEMMFRTRIFSIFDDWSGFNFFSAMLAHGMARTAIRVSGQRQKHCASLSRKKLDQIPD